MLGDAAQRVADVAERAGREHHPQWYEGPRAAFACAIRALDAMGWAQAGMPEELRLDLNEHGEALDAAVRVAVIVAEDELREAREGSWRNGEGQPTERDVVRARLDALRELSWAVGLRAGTTWPAPGVMRLTA